MGGVVRHLASPIGRARSRAVRIAYFLQRRDVATQPREHRGDAWQIAAAVAPEPSVDVPGDEPHGYLSDAMALRGVAPAARAEKNPCRSAGRRTCANAEAPSEDGWTTKVSTSSGASPPCDPNSHG
jgi:hypothetical protein